MDIDPKTFNIAVDAVALAITPKTKAIIPVHLFGQAAPMEALLQLAEEHKIFVVEDNAQGIGATYTFSDGRKQKTGTLGHVGTTSFFPSKNLGAYGDGGALFTNDDDLAHTLRGIVNHGMYQRYHHDVVGVNSRLDAMQAAILDVKLSYLDSYNEARKAAALQYNARLWSKIVTPFREGDCDSHVYHQYTAFAGYGSGCCSKKNGKRISLPECIAPFSMRKKRIRPAVPPRRFSCNPTNDQGSDFFAHAHRTKYSTNRLYLHASYGCHKF